MPRGKKFVDGFKDAPDDGEQLVIGMPSSNYSLNGDITEVAERLIRNYPEQLGHLLNFRLGFLRRASARSDNEFSVQGAGGPFIRSDRERGITASFDGGVWVQGHFWDRFNPLQRQAWIHGYLLCLGVAPKGGRLKMLRRDVNEWATVMRVYGPWSEQLVLFQNAADERSSGVPLPDPKVSRFPHNVPPAPQPN